ncbi:MAG: acyltransferase family protein [Actinomycetota bacterium]
MGEPASQRDTTRGAASMPYLGGLDGVRALAIVAVLLYHADVAWIPGGFLGVEVFFVVSGYLITALLLGERSRTGSIDLRRFWIRRARRLLPALAVFLAGSYGLAVLLADDAVEQWHEEALAAAFYVANWFGIVNDVSYAEGFGRKSFLHHLWSLAVEEQFYLLWPLVLWAALRLIGRRGTLIATLGLIAGSATLMWVLYEPLTDPTRVYYGTDTRAQGLLVGAALALVWQPWRWRHRTVANRRVVSWSASVVGLGALGVVGWAMWNYDLAIATAEPLFRGGFLITSGATALVIAAVATQRSPLGAALAVAPLRWIGTRSYGLYLWHWPIYQLTRPRVDVDLDQWEALAVRLMLTVLVTEASFRLIETPIREGRLWRTIRERPLRLAQAAVVAPLVALVVVGALDAAQRDLGEDEEVIVLASPVVAPDPTAPDPTPTPLATPTPSVPVVDTAAVIEEIPAVTPTPPPTPTATPTPDPSGPPYEDITFIGDSVMEGAAENLLALAPAADIDTQVGRQWFEAPDMLTERLEDDELGDAVVVHLGNNGPISDELFDQMMEPLTEVDLVVFVNVRVPLRWEETVNDEIAAGVERYDNAVMVDWFERSNDRPKFFASDGVHLGTKGRRAYAKLIGNVLGLPTETPESSPTPEPTTAAPDAEPESESETPSEPAPPPAADSADEDAGG